MVDQTLWAICIALFVITLIDLIQSQKDQTGNEGIVKGLTITAFILACVVFAQAFFFQGFF